MSDCQVTLKNQIEAEIWNDIFLKTMADRCDNYINALPFGVQIVEKNRTMIECAKWADEVVLFYREGFQK